MALPLLVSMRTTVPSLSLTKTLLATPPGASLRAMAMPSTPRPTWTVASRGISPFVPGRPISWTESRFRLAAQMCWPSALIWIPSKVFEVTTWVTTGEESGVLDPPDAIRGVHVEVVRQGIADDSVGRLGERGDQVAHRQRGGVEGIDPPWAERVRRCVVKA